MDEFRTFTLNELLDLVEQHEHVIASDIITGGFKTIKGNLKEVIRDTITLLKEKNRPVSVTRLQQDRQDEPNQSVTP